MTREEILAIMRSGDGGTYVRVSDDRQETQRQRDIFDRWLTPLGIKIKPQFRFEDEGFSRDIPNLRPDFQRMMAYAEKGLLKWIAADVQDRFGTKDKFQFAAFMHRLREAGCHFITADWKCWTADDFMAFIEGGMGAETSEKEQKSKSHRILTGKITRARRGEWQGGHIPFGMDVACYGPDDVERWRVVIESRKQIGTKPGKGGRPKRVNALRRIKVYPDGRTEVFEGHRTFPATEYNEVLRLTPSKDKARLAAVVEVFKKFAAEATNYNVLADHLNRLGIKPYYADRWEHYHVRDMLDNPIYIGYQRFNSHGQGRFTEFVGGEERPVENPRGGRIRAKEDWVLSDKPLFKPVVPQDVWDKVQAKLEAEPPDRRSPKSPDLWLADLVYCSHCKKAMRGMDRGTRCEYFCSTYAKGGKGSGCLRNAVNHNIIEARIKEYLAEKAPELQSLMAVEQTGNLELLQPFEQRHVAVFKRCWPAVVGMVKTLQRYPFAKEIMSSHFDAILDGEEPQATTKVKGDHAFLTLVEPLRAIYELIFEKETPIISDRLTELDAEHTRLTDRANDFDPVKQKRAKEKVLAQITAIEEEMTVLEARLVNQSERFNQRFADLQAMSFGFDDAAAALNDPATEARRKAEAVRQVIKQINVTFRPTGKKYPTSEVVDIEIVPVTPDDGPPEYPDRASLSPGTAPPARRCRAGTPRPGR